jgi:hypothetical protein
MKPYRRRYRLTLRPRDHGSDALGLSFDLSIDSVVTGMPNEPPKFTIADDLDPDGDMRADAGSPMGEYLRYLDDVPRRRDRRYGLYA